MKRLVLAIMSLPTLSVAQVPDHLRCYSTKDSLVRQSYTANLTGLTAQTGCIIKVPAKYFCVESEKAITSTPPPPGAPPGPVPGRVLCYKARCPTPPTPPSSLTVADQFGTRSLAPRRTTLVCAPEGVSTTTTPTTTSSTTTTLIAFGPTSGEQVWVVPPGVTSITVDARGAQGGAGPGNGTGGRGGRVQAVLAVTPGQSLSLFVGTMGGRPNGGWNGGGAGGNGSNGGDGGGGGGASDVRVGGNTPAHRVLSAAGGGGAGVDARTGGAGGGLTGGTQVPAGGNGGGGATQVSGGAGGSGLSCQGHPGSSSQGGNGGTGCNGATGGGGGGYFGGGGAGSSEAGGGGSSLVPAGGTTTGDFQAGDGEILISY